MATPISIQLNPSILPFPSINAKAQFFQPNDKFLLKQKPSSSSRQLLQQQLQLASARFVAAAAAASGVAETVEDKLPADIIVTETQEPNSRVRPFLLFLKPQVLVLHKVLIFQIQFACMI